MIPAPDGYINGATTITAEQAFWMLMPAVDHRRARVNEQLNEWRREWREEDIFEAIKWTWLKGSHMMRGVPAFLEHNATPLKSQEKE
jgi:hypothetical protein